ncbi:hypothetical protein M8C21_031962, partial [Ambrosia artemisiifolia]
MSSIFEPSVVDQSGSMDKKEIVSLKFGDNGGKNVVQMYDRLASMASSALVERELKQDESKFWKESYHQASEWSPCADRTESTSSRTGKLQSNTGYILVSANGGLNQQRVAVCNAVVVASLLNATLVIPRFLFSNVWKDPSQFGDIYQEEYFIKTLKDEVNIVKDLPPHLNSLDFKEIGSLITDADINKEATPTEYIEKVLPLLSKNGVIHFLGYGNRLGFDPLPSELQAHPVILLVHDTLLLLVHTVDKVLLGGYVWSSDGEDQLLTSLKFTGVTVADPDMVALRVGGGGHDVAVYGTFWAVSAEELRRSGKCPLTPEEAALVLAALGFTSDTYIYLAGSQIYGGKSRMQPLTTLYPRVITKEDLLSPTELAPFRNFSSQLAALDFIVCATADVFAITDSGSQLSSLVSGFRTYYGGGNAPTLRPSKKRLAEILSKNQTIEWNEFEARVTKMISGAQSVRLRGWGQSIYRQPRCPE